MFLYYIFFLSRSFLVYGHSCLLSLSLSLPRLIEIVSDSSFAFSLRLSGREFFLFLFYFNFISNMATLYHFGSFCFSSVCSRFFPFILCSSTLVWRYVDECWLRCFLCPLLSIFSFIPSVGFRAQVKWIDTVGNILFFLVFKNVVGVFSVFVWLATTTRNIALFGPRFDWLYFGSGCGGGGDVAFFSRFFHFFAAFYFAAIWCCCCLVFKWWWKCCVLFDAIST